MNIPLSLKISFRFKSRKRRGDMISLISSASTIGIAAGVAVLIIGLSVINGFERELYNRILSVVPHGEIEPINQPFVDWRNILKRIEKAPGILVAAPYLNFTGLIEYNDKLQVIKVKGVDPDKEIRLTSLLKYIQDNSWSKFKSGHNKIIIGKGIADKLKVKLNDWLILTMPNHDSKMKLLQLRRIRLQISSILNLNSQLDHNLALVPLIDAQNYLQYGDKIGGIAVKVNDMFNANQLVHDASVVTKKYVRIRSWINTYGYMYRDIQIIRTIIYFAMILVISIACFNIISTLVMEVNYKIADIAILRTLGIQDRLIYAIFIWYGFLVGLIGSIFGIVIGITIILNLDQLVKALEWCLGYRLLSSNVYFINFLPVNLRWIDIVNVILTTIFLSLIASWYPAWRASRIDPARVLNSK